MCYRVIYTHTHNRSIYRLLMLILQSFSSLFKKKHFSSTILCFNSKLNTPVNPPGITQALLAFFFVGAAIFTAQPNRKPEVALKNMGPVILSVIQ